MKPDNNDIDLKAGALLRRFYGYSSFREGQLEIIRNVMSRRDTLVLMPTGGGKSICYQIPALLNEGCCIVISPLISLMKDQVTALNANGIPAAAINSANVEQVNSDIMRQASLGRIKLLYMSPERLILEMEHRNFGNWVSLFAIDEAHCISQWGHDFRPEYIALNRIKASYPGIPVMALTATADKITRDDIATQLCLKNPYIHLASFDRPNISLKVLANPGKAKRINIITRMIDRYPDDSGIVYCLSRKGAETTNAELETRGYRSIVYHAGLSNKERDQAQERFINGDVQVVCATVAFGMGIDKSNIRWVVHNNMPRNMESYYQEIGRAGRDGMKAETLLFYSFADIATLQSFIEKSGQPALNTEKLTRMKEYCEATVCRRRVLLSYFNEEYDHDCGNCDVCLDPPVRFDGTRIVQMALSAMSRTNEMIGLTMLIDILRGSARAELIERGYDRIKTYGVGRDLSFSEWNAYLSQMLQLGIIEIAYTESNHLKITPYGRSILKGERTVMLAKFFFDKTSSSKKRKSAGSKHGQSGRATVQRAQAPATLHCPQRRCGSLHRVQRQNTHGDGASPSRKHARIHSYRRCRRTKSRQVLGTLHLPHQEFPKKRLTHATPHRHPATSAQSVARAHRQDKIGDAGSPHATRRHNRRTKADNSQLILHQEGGGKGVLHPKRKRAHRFIRL